LCLITAGTQERAPHYDPALVKAVARGYCWYEKLVSGNGSSVRSLARELGMNKRYVARIVRCALLAPDIVEKILEGRQSPQLTLDRLFDQVPPSWAEQRKLYDK
jgi:hypothetical protein